ncbi:MAG TPA: oligosaccharide flippase family protein [Thermoanaerobaculia bacterium]|nr:oligosaccharide flippase family protein [Thermoanaerobaculia bacterium]
MSTSEPLSTPQRFLRSTLASYWSLMVRLVVTFGARVLLARLIVPEGHGLYELALRVVVVAGACRDLGLPYHLIRDPRRPYGTVLGFGLISGGLITLALLLGAPLAAPLDPELPRVLRWFAPWVLLDGLVAVPRVFFERELAIGRLVAPEISRGLVVAGISILCAWAGWGVFALVAGDLAGAAIFALLVWRRAWGKVPLEFDWSLVSDLLRRSNLLFLIWVSYQLVTYIDAFIVGAFLDTRTVGFYTRAYMLAFLMRQIVFPRALVPALLEYRHDPERFALAFRVGTLFLMFFEVMAGAFLFVNAEKAVAIVLGPQWGPAVPLLRILCLVPFLDVFSELGGEVLKVLHEDRLWLGIMLLNLASLVAFGIVMTRRWGAPGMAWANFLLLGNLFMAGRMAKLFGKAFGRLLVDMLWIYAVPLAGFGLVAWFFPGGSWGRFWLSLVAAGGITAILVLRFRGPFQSFLAERSTG